MSDSISGEVMLMCVTPFVRFIRHGLLGEVKQQLLLLLMGKLLMVPGKVPSMFPRVCGLRNIEVV